ncbi:MAG: response regulator [Lachnospiraceae bacterium]|nr:response regulator [Lachnospiraceae bacterium]MBQ7780943.1 response regulator [Lachnospiraceae bacterium]
MSHKTTVLLIEDEKSICRFITTSLENGEYRVVTASTGAEGLSLAASLCPDVILLDLGLPDMDGMDIIKQIRTWSQKPIIVISARVKEQDKVMALDLGADDYITKPFGTGELMARIRTSLRHTHNKTAASAKIYRAEGLVIDYEKHMVTLDGAEIHLTQIEFKLLSLLSKNAGKVLTYSFIMEHIWGPYIDSNNQILRVNMANIRRKIEANPAQPRYVFTEIGVGYRMLEDENDK